MTLKHLVKERRISLKTSEFDYTLPSELIAQTPIEPCDASRLLMLDRRTGDIAHRAFHDILAYLRPGDLLVGNDSRVIPAWLHGVKPTGGAVEILRCGRAHPRRPLLTPILPDQETRGDAWECLVGGKGPRPA